MDSTKGIPADASSEQPDNQISRRKFIGGVAAASAFTIVPRHVLGGAMFVAPSDKLNVAQVGCGTQGIRQTTAGLVKREDLQFTCVCDPNTDSTNYVDWSPNGNRNTIRELLGDPSWGENDGGIRAGREVAREIFEAYYGKTSPSGKSNRIRAYADFRELLEKEKDLDAAVIITPDHTHTTLATAFLKNGVAAISHKPVSNVLHEVRRSVECARESKPATHLLAWSDMADLYKLDEWIRSGVIGSVQAVHNWTARPFWPQGWLDYPTEQPPVPAGFNWDLWLGPEPYRPYHPTYTFALYRGWYNYGGGCFADMGNYSLWGIYRILGLDAPVSVEARANTVAFINEQNVSRFRLSQVAFPVAGQLRFRHPAKGSRGPVDVFWYEGGIKPETPEELIKNGEDLQNEGMMIVGDKGTIIGTFHGREPRLLIGGRIVPAEEAPATAEVEVVDSTDEWTNAIREGRKSRGSFENVAPLAEATALQGVAFRFAGKRLDWDPAAMTFTNVEDANKFLRRDYREGWEIA